MSVLGEIEDGIDAIEEEIFDDFIWNLFEIARMGKVDGVIFVGVEDQVREVNEETVEAVDDTLEFEVRDVFRSA